MQLGWQLQEQFAVIGAIAVAGVSGSRDHLKSLVGGAKELDCRSYSKAGVVRPWQVHLLLLFENCTLGLFVVVVCTPLSSGEDTNDLMACSKCSKFYLHKKWHNKNEPKERLLSYILFLVKRSDRPSWIGSDARMKRVTGCFERQKLSQSHISFLTNDTLPCLKRAWKALSLWLKRTNQNLLESRSY